MFSVNIYFADFLSIFVWESVVRRLSVGREDARILRGVLDPSRGRGFGGRFASGILLAEEQIRHRRSRSQILRSYLRTATATGKSSSRAKSVKKIKMEDLCLRQCAVNHF